MPIGFFIPENYRSKLDLNQTERAIKKIKDFFEENLALELNLKRITAPLFVLSGTGINDDLNGIERAVTFKIKSLDDANAEVVHSLAKWKRIALRNHNYSHGTGIYTDMNAIRADEELDNIHSLYVDQWDWEKVISKDERNIDFLKIIVSQIYDVIRRTERFLNREYQLRPVLPEKISFITSQELLDMYPNLTSKEREDAIARKLKAVFIIGIGNKLSNNLPHDGRSPDYDDWNLNGDILVWNEILDSALELSSMGIRVDKDALENQLKLSNKEERKKYYYHQELLSGKLPLTIGGGIGQSRLCMFFLQKAHIGEIQASIWPSNMRKECEENNIILL